MTPYTSFLYFGIALYLIIPLVLAGLLGVARSVCGWVFVSTVLMLIVQFASARTLAYVFGYAFYEFLIARICLWRFAKKDSAAPRPGAASKSQLAVYFGSFFLALLPLVYVKFTPLVGVLQRHPWGFFGISYVSFRAFDVIIGIRDGAITEVPFLRYISYLLFFPSISAGPIDRFKRFSEDWKRKRTRSEFLADLDSAIMHIFRGFLYKFLIAVVIDQYWNDPVLRMTGALGKIYYMYGYSLYLFFDFAGYSAFAVGFSYLLGIHTPENFNLPFISRNIKEFWDRWHISLSWWFRDHVYMRFVLMAARKKWFKNRYTASYIAYFLTMGLMGFWHGFEKFYIVYGLYHATLLVSHDYFARWNKKRKLLTGKVWTVFATFLTFNAVCFGLLIFSGQLI